jgi:RNA polymerase sporulation-specific sigma factor
MIEYTNLGDSDLLELTARGDNQAEEELVSRYMRLVRVCARPLFLAGGESEDLIQEGMFGLLAAIRQYKAEYNTSFKTFAEMCVRNRLRSAVKSASSQKHNPLNNRVPLESILSDESQTTATISTELFQKSPEEQVLARENIKYTEQLYLSLFDSLSKLEKEVLTYYLDGLSYREIAKLTEKSDKAVDNAIQRIRRKTAQMLTSGDISSS